MCIRDSVNARQTPTKWIEVWRRTCCVDSDWIDESLSIRMFAIRFSTRCRLVRCTFRQIRFVRASLESNNTIDFWHVSQNWTTCLHYRWVKLGCIHRELHLRTWMGQSTRYELWHIELYFGINNAQAKSISIHNWVFVWHVGTCPWACLSIKDTKRKWYFCRSNPIFARLWKSVIVSVFDFNFLSKQGQGS